MCLYMILQEKFEKPVNRDIYKTRKSSCVNARGIPPAVLAVLLYPLIRGGGVPHPVLTGGGTPSSCSPNGGSPHPDLGPDLDRVDPLSSPRMGVFPPPPPILTWDLTWMGWYPRAAPLL